MPIFGSKDKNGNLSCNFSSIEKVGSIPPKVTVAITQEDAMNRLSFKVMLTKEPQLYLSYSQICGVDIISEKEIVEKSKSAIGRAVAGGILLGPLGAIVGGVSGVGDKKKKQTRYYFVINYHPAENQDETAVISFEIFASTLHWDKFLKALREKIPQTQSAPTSQYL